MIIITIMITMIIIITIIVVTMIIMTTTKSVFSPYNHNPDDDDAGLGVTSDDNGDNEK